MSYTGLLITPSARWLRAVASIPGDRVIFWSQFLEHAIGGDPVFIVGPKACIVFHSRVNWCVREPLAKTWESYAGAMPITPEELANEAPGIETGVAMLNDFKPVAPPLELLAVGITHRSEVQELSPEEVLVLLRALPPSSQTAWTRRVVGRNNDLRVNL